MPFYLPRFRYLESTRDKKAKEASLAQDFEARTTLRNFARAKRMAELLQAKLARSRVSVAFSCVSCEMQVCQERSSAAAVACSCGSCEMQVCQECSSAAALAFSCGSCQMRVCQERSGAAASQAGEEQGECGFLLYLVFNARVM